MSFEARCSGASPQQRTAHGLVRTFQVPRPFSQLTVRDNLAVAAPGQFGETFVGALLGGERVRAEQKAIAENVDELLRFLTLQTSLTSRPENCQAANANSSNLVASLCLNPETDFAR